ncbi:MAG TPA: hypothetical protein VF770_08495 [Solirubrobacterales bacterium]
MSPRTAAPQRFHLDSARLAAHLVAEEDELFGFGEHEHGHAAAIASRFRDAEEAGAIYGPPEIEVVPYAVDHETLILAIRERELPRGLPWPLRQVATLSFEASEIASFGDASFEACRAGLAELLERANALLPHLAAIGAAEAARCRSASAGGRA